MITHTDFLATRNTNGTYGVWSNIEDRYTHLGLTREQAIDVITGSARAVAENLLNQADAEDVEAFIQKKRMSRSATQDGPGKDG